VVKHTKGAELKMPVQPVAQQGSLRHRPHASRASRERFRHARAVVFDAAPLWGDADRAVVVIDPLLTRSDVQVAFEEIAEKYRISGIELRFDEQPGTGLRVSFVPTDRCNAI
jgi:hypothetical protein